jgi:hypothetical protein
VFVVTAGVSLLRAARCGVVFMLMLVLVLVCKLAQRPLGLEIRASSARQLGKQCQNGDGAMMT